jgi:hypothetical protein
MALFQPADFFYIQYTRPPVVFRDIEPWSKNVYMNDQNIHDSGVQKSTKQNILYLVDYKKDIPENKNLLNDICKKYRTFFSINDNPGNILKSYTTNSYIMHGVSFIHLVDRIWLRINNIEDNEKRNELFKRFKEEVHEGNGHCLNGMMVRLVNIFIGFDENIVVRLNPNQVLSARIPATLERQRKLMNLIEGNESTTFWLAVYKETVKDLEELDVEKDNHVVWLLPLVEPILDDIFIKNGWDKCPVSKRPPLILLKNHTEGTKSISMYIDDTGLDSSYGWMGTYIGSKWNRS